MITEHNKVTNNLRFKQAYGKGGRKAGIFPQKARVAVGQKGVFHRMTSYTLSRTFKVVDSCPGFCKVPL